MLWTGQQVRLHLNSLGSHGMFMFVPFGFISLFLDES